MNPCSACGTGNDDEALHCVECGENLVSSAHRALIGSLVLGVYRITDVLGQGGMSVVYKGQHRMTDQAVALKILPPELAIHTDLRQRFLEEAKALAKLEHGNIVRLYHFGEEAGRFVLAMQLVEGQTFEQRIFKQTRVPWEEAAQVGIQVCRALEYAHERGVVHRDIKPSNILVRSDGTALLMDFGIAKMADGGGSSRLTATGQTMGTVRYMSPEQVRGQTVDFRTDLYSLGATLFEAVIGETPFDGATHFEIMMKHLQEAPPSVRTRGVPVPALFDQALLRAMAKDAARRHPDAAAFRAALENAVATAAEALGKPPVVESAAAERTDETPPLRPLPAPPKPEVRPGTEPITGLAGTLEPDLPRLAPSPRRRLVLLAGAGVLLAGGAAVALTMTGPDPTPPPRPEPRPVAAAPVDAAAPALPDPLLVAGFTPAIDRSFDAPTAVHVLAARADLDADRMATVVHQTRGRLADYLSRKKIAGSLEAHPFHLVIVPGPVMCSRELYAPRAAPEDCATLRFQYKEKARTLYVLDSDNLETVSLPQGVAAHLCITTPALVRLGCMKNLLPPFWDEIEGQP